jgi:hypothetical protein
LAESTQVISARVGLIPWSRLVRFIVVAAS